MISFLDLVSGKEKWPEPAKYTHTCPNCEGSSDYSIDYDSYFCGPCNVWLETACTDPKVMIYFGGRPATPKDEAGYFASI
jgi:hypothetical protein